MSTSTTGIPRNDESEPIVDQHTDGSLIVTTPDGVSREEREWHDLIHDLTHLATECERTWIFDSSWRGLLEPALKRAIAALLREPREPRLCSCGNVLPTMYPQSCGACGGSTAVAPPSEGITP